MKNESAYIVEAVTSDEETFSIFCVSDLEMMAAQKKCILEGYFIGASQPLGNVITAKDFLNKIDPDLNFGIKEGGL